MKKPRRKPRLLVVFERCFLTFRNQADDQREPAAFVERLQESMQLILIQQEVRSFDFLLDNWFVSVVAAGNYTIACFLQQSILFSRVADFRCVS